MSPYLRLSVRCSSMSYTDLVVLLHVKQIETLNVLIVDRNGDVFLNMCRLFHRFMASRYSTISSIPFNVSIS